MIIIYSILTIIRYALSYSILMFGIISVLVLGIVNPAQGEEPRLDLPLQVYCSSFDEAPELNCTLSRDDIEAIVGKVNRIWEPAGIHWNLLSVINRAVDKKAFPRLSGAEDRVKLRERLLSVSPEGVGGDPVWKVVILRKSPIPAGGFYFAKTHTVYFFERVSNGTTSPVVLAHELGHSLGLPHSDKVSNLMRTGNPGGLKTLSAEQISAVRTRAVKGPADRSNMRTDLRGGVGERTKSSSVHKQRRQRMAERLKTFDRNGDGVIHREDVPTPGHPVFQRIDTNHDGNIDTSELADFLS